MLSGGLLFQCSSLSAISITTQSRKGLNFYVITSEVNLDHVRRALYRPGVVSKWEFAEHGDISRFLDRESLSSEAELRNMHTMVQCHRQEILYILLE